MDDSRLSIGGNNPPQTIADELSTKYHEDMNEAAEVLAAANNLPVRIEDGDDETQGKVAEFIKKARALELKFGRAKDDEKAPWDNRVKAIVGFFKAKCDPLEKARMKARAISDDYLQRKKSLEEMRLREEADRKREEAAAALKRAQDAEDTKNDAQRKHEEAARLAAEAKASRESAQTEQEERRADLDDAKARLALLRAEIAAAHAENSRKRRDGEEIDEAEREQRKAAFEAALARVKSEIEAAETALAEARDAAKRAKAEQDEREALEAASKRQVASAQRDVNHHLNEAGRSERVADRIDAKVEGPGAELARTRSGHGATATLTRRWKSTLTDRNAVDIVRLAPFIKEEAISAAGYKWMMNQTFENRSMPGFIMEEIQETLIV